MRSDSELEADVLAAVLADPRLAGAVTRGLDEDDFTDEGHRAVFAAVSTIVREEGADAVSPTVVRDEVRRLGGDERVVAGLLGTGPVGSVEAKVRRLRELRRLRVLEQALADIRATADPDAAMGRLRELGAELGRLAPAESADWPSVLDELLDERERELREERRVRTGLPTLDGALGGGLAPGWFVVVGARTGTGKTTIGLQTAYRAARAGQPVMVASLEEAPVQVAERVLRHAARLARRDPQALIRAGLDPRHRDLPIVVECRPALADIVEAARRCALSERGLGLVVVDYVQLVQVPKRDSRVAEVSEVTAGLKRAAMELGVPVLGLAQLNRAPLLRADRKPTLADLRESGSLEQDADVVILLHQEGSLGSTSGRALLAKNRYGPTAEFPIRFVYETGTVVEVSDDA